MIHAPLDWRTFLRLKKLTVGLWILVFLQHLVVYSPQAKWIESNQIQFILSQGVKFGDSYRAAVNKGRAALKEHPWIWHVTNGHWQNKMFKLCYSGSVITKLIHLCKVGFVGITDVWGTNHKIHNVSLVLSGQSALSLSSSQISVT